MGLLMWVTLHTLVLQIVAAHASPTTSELVDKATLRVDLGTHHSAIAAVAASPDGRVLATGGSDRVVRLWDRKTGDLLRTLRPPSQDVGQEGRITALAFSPDGHWLAVSGQTHFWDGAEGRVCGVYLFDTNTGRLAHRLRGATENADQPFVSRLIFSADGRHLVSLIKRGINQPIGRVTLYEAPGTAQATDSPLLPQSGMADFDLGPDGRWFAVKGHGLAIFPTLSRSETRETYYSPTKLKDKTQSREAFVRMVRVSPDGRQLALATYSPTRIEVRDSHQLTLRASLDLDEAANENVTGLRWSPDGKSLLMTSTVNAGGQRTGRLQRIRIANKLTVQTLRSQPAALLAMDVLSDGSILLGDEQAHVALLGATGSVQLQRDTDSLQVTDPGELYIDDSASQIWLRFGPGKHETVGFSLQRLVQEQRLDIGKPLPNALQPPRTEVPSSHRLVGWRHQGVVTLDGAGLNLGGEVPSCLAISRDQKSFVIGTDHAIRRFFFDRSTAAQECPAKPTTQSNLPSPCLQIPLPSAALAIHYSGDGQHIVAALADGSIRWYSAHDGSAEQAFVLHRDLRRWVLWQPQGSFIASIGGAGLVGWHLNPAKVQAAAMFPLQRFTAQLYDPTKFVPDPLRGTVEVVRTPPEPPAENRPISADVPRDPAKPLGLGEIGRGGGSSGAGSVLRRILPPVATILAPSEGSQVSDGQATLRVLVHSPTRQSIRGVRVLVNGRPDRKARGIIDVSTDAKEESAALAAVGAGAEVFSIPVLLPAGRSTVAVVAEGSAGTSVPAILHLQSKVASAPPEASRPRLVVLAVGVGGYPSEALRLRYPAKDANDLVRVLKEHGSRMYETVSSRVITDEAATLSGIRQGLGWLQDSLRPDDTALIFLAGHGINAPDSGQYLFLPRDVDMTQLRQTALAAAELQQTLSALPSRVLLFLDTCHSGNVLGGRRSPTSDAPPTTPDGQSGSERGDLTRFVGDLTNAEQGLVVMAASTGRQASQESADWQNGVFTLALLEGLRGKADFRKTGRVTVNMLDLYVSERVRELTDGAQTPATAKPVTIPDFPVLTLR